jgi:GntR family transcriptional regulator
MDGFSKDRRSLALQIRDYIRQMMKEKYYRAGDRLPSEESLVETFGVSRATVREALKLLEEEKIIIVRHGLGRFVAHDPSSMLSEDITRLESVTEMAHDMGIPIETEVISFEKIEADDIIRARLDLPLNEYVYKLERTRRAAGETVIFSIDIFPCAIMPGDFSPDLFQGSLLSVLEDQWAHPLGYSRATISAELLPPDLCEKVHDHGHNAWVLMEQVNYDQHDKPVLYSRDFHRSDKFRFHVLRRRR